MINAGSPSFLGLGVGERLRSNFLAPTVAHGVLKWIYFLDPPKRLEMAGLFVCL